MKPMKRTRLAPQPRMRTIFSALLFALGSTAFVGCTSARNALGTNSSPCYLALPVAEDAVHGRGTFGGVRLVTAKTLASRVHFLHALETRAGGRLGDVCVVEYRGKYTLGQVERPLGRPPASGTGKYAIVVVDRSTNKLLATLVRETQPVQFRHTA